MLNFIARKIYISWSMFMLAFPLMINLLWILAFYSAEQGQGTRDRFISFFPLVFQYTQGIGFISLFFSALSLMLSLRVIRDFNKYSWIGALIFALALYLSVFNLYNLM